ARWPRSRSRSARTAGSVAGRATPSSFTRPSGGSKRRRSVRLRSTIRSGGGFGRNLPSRARTQCSRSRRNARRPRKRAVGLRARAISEEAGPRRRDRCQDAPRPDRCDAKGGAGPQPGAAEKDRRPLGAARRRSRRNPRHAVDGRKEGDAKTIGRDAAAGERYARGRVLDHAGAAEDGGEENAKASPADESKDAWKDCWQESSSSTMTG